MITVQRTICPITNTEVPLFNLNDLEVNKDTSYQDKGRQISKERQRQICLNLIFMLGMSQGINEKEISKILSLNLNVLDSFENKIGTILNRMVKYMNKNEDNAIMDREQSSGDELDDMEISDGEYDTEYNALDNDPNAERLIITNVESNDPPRFKLFCEYLKTKEFENHARSLRLPPLPDILDADIGRIATGRNKYKEHWERYEYLGDRVLRLFISKIVLKYFITTFNQSLRNVIKFLNSNKLFAAYCMCLNLPEDVHIPYKIYADNFKAYFGGLYLDQGEDDVTEYLTELIMPFLCNLANYQSKIGPHTLNDKLLGKIAAEYFDMEWLI